jgi:hypothetical protein
MRPEPTGSTEVNAPRLDATFDGTVGAGADAIDELLGGAVLADGLAWRIDKMGASALGRGDDVAARVSLELFDGRDWTVLRAFGLTAAVSEVSIGLTIPGDGVKKLRIVRGNAGSAKVVTAWITGFQYPP